VGLDSGAQRVGVQRGGRLAAGVVSAPDHDHWLAEQGVLQVLALQVALSEADQYEADGFAFPFDYGVCREGRGERHQLDWLVRGRGKYVGDGLAYAEGKVLFGSQGFRGGEHLLGVVEEYGVGVGAAGVYAEFHCHFMRSKKSPYALHIDCKLPRETHCHGYVCECRWETTCTRQALESCMLRG